MRGSFAAALTSASRERLIPGAMIPPRKRPSADDIESRRRAEVDDDQVALMLGMSRDHVERTVGADVLRLVDIELERPVSASLSGDQRFDVEIFAREHFEIVERARDDRADDHGRDIGLRVALKLQQLVKPDGILVRGAPRIGRDAPARLDGPAVDKREDEVRITGIDGEQHGARLRGRTAARKASGGGDHLLDDQLGCSASRAFAR